MAGTRYRLGEAVLTYTHNQCYEQNDKKNIIFPMKCSILAFDNKLASFKKGIQYVGLAKF